MTLQRLRSLQKSSALGRFPDLQGGCMFEAKPDNGKRPDGGPGRLNLESLTGSSSGTLGGMCRTIFACESMHVYKCILQANIRDTSYHF